MSNTDDLLLQILSELKQIKEILAYSPDTIAAMEPVHNWPWEIFKGAKMKHRRKEDDETEVVEQVEE